MSADRAIWYAAFGSNLLRERFSVYLTGGVIPGSTTGRVQDGARDPSPPTGDRAHVIEHPLRFTGRSGQWGGGGTAAIDTDHDPAAPTLGRAYRITVAQFEDVVRQENRASTTPHLDLELLGEARRLDVSPGKYGRVLLLGHIDGEPVATITTPERSTDLRPAHHSYLAVMARGLAESHGLTAEEAARYLAGRPGNAGRIDPLELVTHL